MEIRQTKWVPQTGQDMSFSAGVLVKSAMALENLACLGRPLRSRCSAELLGVTARKMASSLRVMAETRSCARAAYGIGRPELRQSVAFFS